MAGEEWRENITATVFGGVGDDQDSAYSDIEWIDSETVGVAFPYRWKGDRPRVVVEGPKGVMKVPVIDVGPWNIYDDDYVIGGERPLVEKQYASGLEAQNGQIPNNDAGIDLTPPVAKRVGVSGKGKVRWRFA
jgi:hypothetical protein